MTVVYLLQMVPGKMGNPLHEVMGIAFVALFVIHHLLNRGWLRRLGSRRTSYARIVLVSDVLLTVCMVVMLFTGLAVTASAADTIKGYLVSYTFQAGDTMYGVCDAKGIDANTQLNTIARINNITNYNYMLPGKVLWLPSSTATTASPYYSLLSHTLAPGETPASLCQSYGVDYNGSYNLLAALNNNLTVFMAGQQFILPLYIDPTNAAATTTVTRRPPPPPRQP